MVNIDKTTSVALIAAMLTFAACGDDDDGARRDGGARGDAAVGIGDGAVPGNGAAGFQARFLIEHNAADDDTGFQIFFDGSPWTTLSVSGPGDTVLDVEALGQMADFGLTEMFLETNEPPADEMPREAVLALFPEGAYTFEVVSVDGQTQTIGATLSHNIPAAAEIRAPMEGEQVPADEALAVSWSAVSSSLTGSSIDIVAYKVIVGRDLALPSGEGFSALVYEATVPSSVTSLSIPAEYLRPGTPYGIEVLALEATGNQTIAATTFSTTGTAIDDLTEVGDPGAAELAAAKYLIEHNATDDDTGYQIFLDGRPWSISSVAAPDSVDLVAVRAQGNLTSFGLTEMFFETNEPPASEVPLLDVLALFPEGGYTMSATAVEDATIQTGTATLTHTIPAPANIVNPAAGSDIDSASPLAVSWEAVTSSLEGSPVNIIAYQLIVQKEQEPSPAAGFFAPTLSVRVPSDTTNMTIPAELLESGTAYEIEVLAVEESGNQTIALRAFQTN